jgi:hypothetical protein
VLGLDNGAGRSGSSATSAIVLSQRAARRRQRDDLIALPLALVVGGLAAVIALPEPPPPPTTKTCRTRERDLPLPAFNLDGGRPRTECRECEGERRAASRRAR